MYAVIRTGGKQYKVAPQDVLKIEKIEGAAGDAVRFSDVLMVAGEGEPSFGVPLVSGALVSAEVVEQGRGPKVLIFKKKRRQNYRRKRGHRQELTTVRILDILTEGRSRPALEASAVSPAQEASEPGASKKTIAREDAGAEAPPQEAVKKPRAKKAEKTKE